MAADAVIFDIGGVLVDVDTTRGLWARLLGMEPSELTLERLVSNDIFREFGTGRVSAEAFHTDACRRLGEDWDFRAFEARWCEIFQPMPGMAELVDEVAAVRPVGICSDTEPIHWGFLSREFPLVSRISKPSLSFEVGRLKPDPEFFLQAARDVGVAADRCFFTDDLPRNVEGARRAGMDAEVFQGADELRRQLAARGVPIRRP